MKQFGCTATLLAALVLGLATVSGCASTGASAGQACVRPGARIPVVASGVVRLCRVGAQGGCGIARPDHVALIQRRAHHRLSWFANAGLAKLVTLTSLVSVRRVLVLEPAVVFRG